MLYLDKENVFEEDKTKLKHIYFYLDMGLFMFEYQN